MESLFDGIESQHRKESGMTIAAIARGDILETARAVAVELGRRYGEVHMDMVNMVLEEMGIDPEDLGPAAGSVFRGNQWRFTGVRVKSMRKKNHARELKVWRYQGG